MLKARYVPEKNGMMFALLRQEACQTPYLAVNCPRLVQSLASTQRTKKISIQHPVLMLRAERFLARHLLVSCSYDGPKLQIAEQFFKNFDSDTLYRRQ